MWGLLTAVAFCYLAGMWKLATSKDPRAARERQLVWVAGEGLLHVAKYSMCWGSTTHQQQYNAHRRTEQFSTVRCNFALYILHAHAVCALHIACGCD
jgi:hypothetical protein